MKKIYMITFGCQMNVYDSSRMLDFMKLRNYELTENISEADVIIMNTCHIREKAKEKVFSELGKIKSLKQRKIDNNEYLVVAIAGCVAKAEGQKIFERMPIVDIVIGGESYHKIAYMVDQVFENHKYEKSIKLIDIDFNTEEKFASFPKIRNTHNVSEVIAVQDGCNKFCSYCVVPFTRGREYSRPVEDIINEIKYLADNGTREVTLLGQNVDNYLSIMKNNNKTIRLSDLIYIINNINGIERIRYLSSYPSQFTDDLIYAHRDLKKLMPLIYIPVQSGSNHVLKLMNRKYTREQYLELIDKIKKNVENVAFSSDFIVGFAGETERDFEDTLDLVKKVNYAVSFSFKYSPRPNTVGINMPDQVPENIKIERLDRLQEALNKQQIIFNRNCIGNTMEVLIENESATDKNIFFGRTLYSQAVMVEKNSSSINTGNIVKVQIKEANLKTLKGIANI